MHTPKSCLCLVLRCNHPLDRGLESRVVGLGEVSGCRPDVDVGSQTGVWGMSGRKVTDQRQIELDSASRQTDEEETAAVDS